ncbi:M48 family metalloprotease [Desulfonatronovibrio hydrogenovorans]|uniref:M48 family metalloprotease n=1 Tax=Desulfonatronovibrio hydrogenovorans TaxID=53245 RepID=UPI00054DCC30|nr:M48 family metalloprotease [Desulfonatronovibrio hydrogenovorans]
MPNQTRLTQLSHSFSDRFSRRDFLYLAAAASIGLCAGCAVNPVTGRHEILLMSEAQEINVDRQNSPHQISADYGITRDKALNDYVSHVGQSIARNTHRAHMPYSFNTLNAPYVNAYAFPGGTIGITRGILLDLENEAELASLIGHEAGHVSARHTSQRMTRGLLAAVVLSGASVAAGSQVGDLVAGLGGIGAGALLAGYSRNQEREADALGLEYMVKSNYNPEGFVGLMSMLNEMSGKNESSMAVLFSTHPMSSERYRTALNDVETRYAAHKKTNPVFRERYMDNTAGLRKIGSAIKAMQDGDGEMMKDNPGKAMEHYQRSLQTAPDDYAGNLKMAKCHLALKNSRQAHDFALKAKETYPEEPQASHILGMANLQLRNFEQALARFDEYENSLPGNPNTTFFQGFSLEGMGRREQSARKYYAYLQNVSQGEYARHAHTRLQEWGYLQ